MRLTMDSQFGEAGAGRQGTRDGAREIVTLVQLKTVGARAVQAFRIIAVAVIFNESFIERRRDSHRRTYRRTYQQRSEPPLGEAACHRSCGGVAKLRREVLFLNNLHITKIFCIHYPHIVNLLSSNPSREHHQIDQSIVYIAGVDGRGENRHQSGKPPRAAGGANEWARSRRRGAGVCAGVSWIGSTATAIVGPIDTTS